jgi:hypothetical protein
MSSIFIARSPSLRTLVAGPIRLGKQHVAMMAALFALDQTHARRGVAAADFDRAQRDLGEDVI